MAGRREREFGVFDQTPQKWAFRLGPTGLEARSSFLPKTNYSPFIYFGAFARKRNPNVGSALQARLSSIANAPGANFLPFRCPPRGLGRAALDSDHAECPESVSINLGTGFPHTRSFKNKTRH